MKKNQNNNSLWRRLLTQYLLVVEDTERFEKVSSFKLVPLNFIFFILLILIFTITCTVGVLVFTPVKDYVPGYFSDAKEKLLIENANKVLELEKRLSDKKQYFDRIDSLIHERISGDIEVEEVEPENPGNIESISKQKSAISNFHFYTPLKGISSRGFDAEKEHYGIDLVAKKNEAVKATLTGIVILSTWSAETGHTIAIQHSNNLVSIYKHNSQLLKKEGDYVKAGEVVAIIGNSGENTSGPHLHFELWFGGSPINPENYMNF